MKRPQKLLLAVLFALLVVPGSSQAQSWKDSLAARLSSRMVVASVTSDRLRITKPGTVLLVQLEGVSASPGKDASYLKNHLRDGQVQQAKGLAAALSNKKTNRDYRVGERVYLTKIDVNDNDIQLFLISTETNQIQVDGNSQQTRYKAVLQVDFPKGTLAATDAAAIERVISSALKLASEESGPKTVELGQTPEQVEGALGKPETILKLALKTIWVYKALKVTFVDGKVSDVQ